MRKLLSTIAVAALTAGVATQAAATEGWYGRIDAGYSVDGELDIDGAVVERTFDEDWMGAIGAGYAFRNGFRLEGEYSYRQNEIEQVPGVDATAHAGFINAYYDFNRGGRFEPYIGLGVGYIDPEVDDAPPPFEIDGGLAYQALVGVAIGLTERLDLDVGYRYVQSDDLDWTEIGSGELQYNHQAVTVGLRYQFSNPAPAYVPPPPPPPVAPPPPPAPPPAATCPTSDFVVYFEWDRSNLNAAAMETIDAAVTRARQCNVSNVVVIGHTDTSGSTQYNQGLSERRAAVVRDALVARGMASGAIQTQARGETDLARATRDGVREPLNRRTAVTISFR